MARSRFYLLRSEQDNPGFAPPIDSRAEPDLYQLTRTQKARILL